MLICIDFTLFLKRDSSPVDILLHVLKLYFRNFFFVYFRTLYSCKKYKVILTTQFVCNGFIRILLYCIFVH